LAIDLNGNGSIDDGGELFGEASLLPDGTRARDGFEALRAVDGNGDGVIDSRDAVFDHLRVWVDADHDGVSQPGELLTLRQAGVASIQTGGEASTATDHGNLIGLVAHYTTDSGVQRAAADVWFQFVPTDESTQVKVVGTPPPEPESS
jgi:hypothetical protein